MIDASVWVSYFLPYDKHHAATVAGIEAMAQAGEAFAVPTILLPELAGALARRSGDPESGREAASQVLAWPLLEVVPQDDALIAFATELAAGLSMRGADSIYVADAKVLGRPLITWDDEQLSRGGRVIAAHTPDQLPS